jgi:hypothetical protein
MAKEFNTRNSQKKLEWKLLSRVDSHSGNADPVKQLKQQKQTKTMSY